MKFIDLLLNQELNITNYESNQVIFYEGDICNKLGVLIEGEIIISTYIDTNINIDKEEIIRVINKSTPLIGQFLLFSNHPYYLGNGITKIKSKIIWINKDKLIDLLANNKDLLNQYMMMICQESFNIKQQVKLLAHKNIRDRILFYLNSHQINNIIKIKSVQNLSDILSLPRPSVSRELTNLEKEGIIIRNKKEIILR